MSMVMTDTAPVEVWTFGGVDTLNGTQIPDAYFDEVMAPLGPSAFMVLMYIARRTFGFKRYSDQISLDQICHGIVTRDGRRLDYGTGLAKSTVVLALDRLVAFGVIRKQRNDDPQGGQLANTYQIVFKNPGVSSPPPLSENRTGAVRIPDSPPVRGSNTPRPNPGHGPVRDSDTQQTVETTNSRRQTDRSNRKVQVAPPPSPIIVDDSSDSSTITTVAQGNSPPPSARLTELIASVDQRVTALSDEFGDSAPHASRTRVANVQRMACLDDDALVQLLGEAATITRSQAHAITKRGRDGLPVRMPYLLRTLHNLALPDDGVSVLPHSHASQGVLWSADDADEAPSASAVIDEVDDVWAAALGELRLILTPENYATWLASTRVLTRTSDLLRIGVPKPFQRDWLEYKLHARVTGALQRLGHDGLRVEWILTEAT
jgi:hypothetical protein